MRWDQKCFQIPLARLHTLHHKFMDVWNTLPTVIVLPRLLLLLHEVRDRHDLILLITPSKASARRIDCHLFRGTIRRALSEQIKILSAGTASTATIRAIQLVFSFHPLHRLLKLLIRYHNFLALPHLAALLGRRALLLGGPGLLLRLGNLRGRIQVLFPVVVTAFVVFLEEEVLLEGQQWHGCFCVEGTWCHRVTRVHLLSLLKIHLIGLTKARRQLFFRLIKTLTRSVTVKWDDAVTALDRWLGAEEERLLLTVVQLMLEIFGPLLSLSLGRLLIFWLGLMLYIQIHLPPSTLICHSLHQNLFATVHDTKILHQLSSTLLLATKFFQTNSVLLILCLILRHCETMLAPCPLRFLF